MSEDTKRKLKERRESRAEGQEQTMREIGNRKSNFSCFLLYFTLHTDVS